MIKSSPTFIFSYSIVHSECHITEARRVESECCLMLALDCCSCTAVGPQLKEMTENMKSYNSFTYLFEVHLREKCFTRHWMRLEEIKCLKGEKNILSVCLAFSQMWSITQQHILYRLCVYDLHPSTAETSWMPGTQVSLRLLAEGLGQIERKQYCFSFELGWSERGSASWEISGLFLELAWEFRRRSPRKFQLLQEAMKYIFLWCGESECCRGCSQCCWCNPLWFYSPRSTWDSNWHFWHGRLAR